MPVIVHPKNITFADCTNTDMLRPSDWNSSHNQFWTLQGNTLGGSTLSGTNVQLSGGSNISLSVNGQTIGIVGSGGVALSIGLYTGNALFDSGTVLLGTAPTGYSTGAFSWARLNVYPLVIGSGTSRSVRFYAEPRFHNEAYFGWGLTNKTLAYPPIMAIMDAGTIESATGAWSEMEIMFDLRNGAEYQSLRFEGLTDESVHTVAYELHLPRLGVSTQGNTAGSTGLVSGLNQSLVLVGSDNITLSQSSNASGATVSIIGAAGGGGGVVISAPFDSISSGTLEFVSTNTFPGLTTCNVVPAISTSAGGAKIAFRCDPYFLQSEFMMWGVSSDAIEPFLNPVASNTEGYVNFQFTGGGTRQWINFESVGEGSALAGSVAYWAHLPGMGVSTQGNTAGTTGLVTGARKSLLLVGSNNITLSQSSNVSGATVSIIGGDGGGGVAISASNSLWSSGTVTLTGSNITIGTAAGQIVVSGPVSHAQQTGISALVASNTTFTSGTVTISGSRNITIGSAAGQIVVTGPDLTPYLTTAALSGHSHGVTLALTNINGTTGGNSVGIQLSLSAGAGGGGNNSFSVAGLSEISGTAVRVVFSNVTNVTLLQTTNGSTMTLGFSGNAPGGGGGDTRHRAFFPDGVQFSALSAIGQGSYSVHLVRIRDIVAVSRMGGFISISATSSTAGTGTLSITVRLGLYSLNGSTLSRAASGSVTGSTTWSSNATASVAGIRRWTAALDTPLTITNLGDWWAMMQVSSSSSSRNCTLSVMGGAALLQTAALYYHDAFGNNSASSKGPFYGMGIATFTSGAMPASMALSHISQTGVAVSRANWFVQLYDQEVY